MNTLQEHSVERPITDLPIAVSIEKYNEAAQILVHHWCQLPHKPISIYQIGQVAAPGISDLDFILVFEDTTKLDWDQYLPEIFPPWIQDLFTHPPYITTLNSWPDLQGWHPTFNMTLLRGRELPEPVIEKQAEPGLALGMLIDYLIVKIPADVIKYGRHSPVRTRLLLCLIHSIKYIFLLAQKAEVPVVPDAAGWIKEIDDLRTNWFERDPLTQVQHMFRLWEKSCWLIVEQIKLVDDFLNESGGETIHGTFGKRDSIFNFHSPYSGSLNMKSVLETPVTETPAQWQSPCSFLKVLGVYADEEMTFRVYFNKNKLHFKTGLIQTKWETGLRYHAHAMIQSRAELAKMGVPSQKYIALGCMPLDVLTRSKRFICKLLKGERSFKHVLSITKHVVNRYSLR